MQIELITIKYSLFNCDVTATQSLSSELSHYMEQISARVWILRRIRDRTESAHWTGTTPKSTNAASLATAVPHHRRCETLLQTRPCERARQLRQCGTLNHFKKEQAMDSFPGSGKAIFLLLRSPAHVDGRVAGKEYKSLWLESTDMKLKSGALQRTLLADVSRQKQSGAFLDKRLSSWRVANYLGAGKESRGTAGSAGSRAFPQDASSSVGRPHPTLDWTPRRSVS